MRGSKWVEKPTADSRIPSSQLPAVDGTSGERDLDGDVRIRVVPLCLAGAILGAELLVDVVDRVGIRDRRGPSGPRGAGGVQADRRRPPHVAIPIALRSPHREQMEPFAIPNEP